MDGFDQNEAASKGDEGHVVLGGFLAAERDAFEALELADGLLDAGAAAGERLWEEAGPVFRVRGDAAVACRLPVGLAVGSLVGDDGARGDVGADAQQHLELPAIAGFAAGEVEVERTAVEVGLQVDWSRTRRASGRALGSAAPFGAGG